ncbi:MAG: hypothetical protein J7K21_04070, partial [Desulfurococcales archaeon]|nr:hypothetical protein [Desulfurococcales archaeon]
MNPNPYTPLYFSPLYSPSLYRSRTTSLFILETMFYLVGPAFSSAKGLPGISGADELGCAAGPILYLFNNALMVVKLYYVLVVSYLIWGWFALEYPDIVEEVVRIVNPRPLKLFTAGPVAC